jgi:hypothetical protein
MATGDAAFSRHGTKEWGASCLISCIATDGPPLHAADMDMDMDITTLSYHNLWVDIDQVDGNDPLACAHIANDIVANLFRAEVPPPPPTHPTPFHPNANDILAKLFGAEEPLTPIHTAPHTHTHTVASL